MRWFLYLPLNIIMAIIGGLGSPIWALFVQENGHLPRWLKYLDTPDNTADGDEPFKEHHAPYRGDNITRWQRYVNRVFWYFRNPAYSFDWDVLAFQYKEGDEVKVWGRRKINGEIVKNDIRLISGDLTMGGWFFARCDYAWQLYINHHWNDTHCTKLNFGHKLWSRNDISRDRKCMFVFSPTGFWKKITKP
jgi:hypothetical protein